MPTYSSLWLLNNLRHQTETNLTKAVSDWQMRPPEQMNFKESPEKWSASQCLWHLNSYGDFYLPAIEQSILSAQARHEVARESFKTGRLGHYFTQLMNPAPIGKSRKKMKAPSGHRPPEEQNCYAVVARFIEQQERLLILLEEAEHIDIGKARTPISISKLIKLKLGDTFGFLVAHNNRHIQQAERALASFTRQ